MGVERDTAAGNYIGVRGSGAVSWRGITYATARRFAEPELVSPPARPTVCADFGPACAQNELRTLGGKRSEAEGALYLNVYSPAADDARRPVVVWIHGGAYQGGAGSGYDGAPLAARGDVVVVTVNYRLGVLGFTDLGDLGVPRNLGIRDQIAALTWVRDNIELFGGDPGTVTVAGESAGSMSVSLLMSAPVARPLFHRAIMQSGALNLVHDAAVAERLGAEVRSLLDPEGMGLSALTRASVGDVLAAQRQVGRRNRGTIPAGPVFDGDLLPASFEEALTAPPPPVPLLAGWNRDEIRFFDLPGVRGSLPRSRAELSRLLHDQLGTERASRILATYSENREGGRALGTDVNFAMPTRHFAERHADAGNPTWIYRLDKRGLLLGAPHAADLTYLWDQPGAAYIFLRGGPLRGRRLGLADRFRRHWLSFVRDGRPAGDWPAYEPASRKVRLFDDSDATVSDVDSRRHEAWNGRDVLVARGCGQM
ncbi:carboxylesterase/lipase family protein [Streptomyces coelicoflavus]|uniref:carboxylesterase/lipase family protein n=1 Tax=Streptomyces coelicoflavus TaxID=285562 RepID=UPI00331A44C1